MIWSGECPNSADGFIREGLPSLNHPAFLGRQVYKNMHSPSNNQTRDTDETANRIRRKRSRIEDLEPAASVVNVALGDVAKRRRRKLSCETCQKRKCRCDYDPVTRTCHRCRTLR